MTPVIAPLRLLSSLAFASTLETLLPAFRNEAGIAVETTLLPTALLLPRIRAGERGDAAILTQAGIGALVADGVLEGARDLAVSSVGIGVRAGAVRPEMGTVAGLVAALLAARSVGLSRGGASGIYFEGLLDRLGIGDAVRAKAVVIESGYTGDLVVDGRAELAVQQVSELLMVPGVDVVGALPPGLGAETVFTGGVFVGAAHAGAARRLLGVIAGAGDVLRARGLAPV